MRKFKFPRKYYDDRYIYKKASIEINNGVSVLIGCNGSGKSTLTYIIMEQLKELNIPVYKFDNYTDGGTRSMQGLLFNGNMDQLANMYCASEGERISINLGTEFHQIINFLDTGRTKDKFAEIFGHLKPIETKERWIIFDAVDSGFSIDNVIDFKEYILNSLLEKSKKMDRELYFIITANEYEMCVGLPCINIIDCKYVEINTYEDYKKQILKTRKDKDKYIDKWEKENN